MITLRDIQNTSYERAARWHPDGMDEWSALEWAGAMCGEAGEAANAAKKLKRLQGNIASLNHEERHLTNIVQAKAVIAEECADTILYALLLMSRIDIDAESCLQRVFNKKSEEYGFPERL